MQMREKGFGHFMPRKSALTPCFDTEEVNRLGEERDSGRDRRKADVVSHCEHGPGSVGSVWSGWAHIISGVSAQRIGGLSHLQVQRRLRYIWRGRCVDRIQYPRVLPGRNEALYPPVAGEPHKARLVLLAGLRSERVQGGKDAGRHEARGVGLQRRKLVPAELIFAARAAARAPRLRHASLDVKRLNLLE